VNDNKGKGHHKNCIKTYEAKWSLEFIGGKYDCAGESSSNCKQQTRPILKEGDPHLQTRSCLTAIKI
jgi:hypothetical protein